MKGRIRSRVSFREQLQSEDGKIRVSIPKFDLPTLPLYSSDLISSYMAELLGILTPKPHRPKFDVTIEGENDEGNV